MAELQRLVGNNAITGLLRRGAKGQRFATEPTSSGQQFLQRDERESKYIPPSIRRARERDKAQGKDAAKPDEATPEGPSLFPAIETVSKTLTAIKSIAGVVQELTHNNTATGRISLPPMVPGGKAADYKPMYDLDRIFIHMMATEVCRQAFEIGMAHGIDFKQIGPDGRPKPSAPGGSPPGSEPGKKASQLDKKASEPAVRRVNWDEETVKALTSSLSGLQDLAQSALKAKMKSSLEEKIKAEELPPGHFFWDAKNRSGRRKMTELDEAMGNLSGAWGRLQISVIVEYLENGAALGGMPQEVSYFGLVADPELLAPHWVIGGAIDWKTKNDLEIEATHTTQPHMYKPEGCYQVHTLWKWDESTSVMDCAVTPASLSFTLLADLKLSGDEPDDGWF